MDAQLGGELHRGYGNCHMAIRSAQEQKMEDSQHRVLQTQTHLAHDPELWSDVAELRLLGAIPRFRGPSPGSFRVRVSRRNMVEREFIATKMWADYTRRGAMFICPGAGFFPDDEFFCAPPTTVAKKLPDRTVSEDTRAISAGRRGRRRFRKTDYWMSRRI